MAKFNSSGTKQWVRQLGDAYSEGKDVDTDNAGNVYIVGYVNGDFDGNSNLGSADIIVAKYNPSGTKQSPPIWDNSADYGTGIAIDSSDNIYITGYTAGGLYGNTNAGGDDIFVIKLNTSGIIQ